ncbi:MAG: GHKL domain-containing protein [Turicibacter sp.]|nr:GHKL domain-containing protein [Turicibacter sp.]
MFAHYLIEFAQLYTAVCFIFNVEKKRKVWLGNILIVILLATIDIYRFIYLDGELVQYFFDMVVMTGLAFAVMIYALRGFKYLFLLLAVHIVNSFISTLVAGIGAAIFSTSVTAIVTNPLYGAIARMPLILIFLILNHIMKKANVTIDISIFSKKEIFLVIISLSTFGFYLGAMQQFRNYSQSAWAEFANVAGTIGGVIVIGIIIAYILKNAQLKKIENLRMIQEKLVEQQQHHHKAFIEREKETRKFRHDFVQQLLIISELIRTEEFKELEEYVSELTSTMSDIQNYAGIETGSNAINAVLFSLQSQYKDDEIAVEWRGLVPRGSQVSGKDMALLFINLLKNAFEAASKCTADKFVEVKITQQVVGFDLMVKNSYDGILSMENEKIRTSKEDDVNHGFGLIIIDDVIRKYKGSSHVTHSDGVFKTEIKFVSE